MAIAVRSIRKALMFVALVASSAAAQPQNPAPLRSLEDAIETSTDAVVLPSTTSGSVTLRDCRPPCSMNSLQLTDQTRFFVGGSQVTYADFNAYVLRTGAQFLMVFHKPGEAIATRLMVFGQL
ncbi:MAG TPA: hypothetical protein VK025_03725 [Steroidobacter sp.]|jgi:hypothetical protein|nr:hypothetical protein [Steroidobacteraceae bacterium]HLS80493.1 hypothetical protein [Steroidobacter sp.]